MTRARTISRGESWVVGKIENVVREKTLKKYQSQMKDERNFEVRCPLFNNRLIIVFSCFFFSGSFANG